MEFPTRDEILYKWFVEHPNVIPPMSGPFSTNWDQPRTSEIEIDDTHALMTRVTFEKLLEYSATNPSGCYPGKMWRREDGAFDREFLAKGGKPVWMLCWYGLSVRGPDWCTTEHRKILLVD